MYITLEPYCHYGKTKPCYKQIIQSGIKEIFIEVKDPHPKVSGKSINLLKKNRIIIHIRLMKKKSKFINIDFFKWIKIGIL